MRNAPLCSVILMCWLLSTGASLASGANERNVATIFTQPNCSQCAKARNFLKEHSIPYKEMGIYTSTQNLRTFEAIGGIGTPFMLFRDMRIHGFSAEQWEEVFTKPEH